VKTKLVRGDSSDLKRIRDTYRLVVEANRITEWISARPRLTEPRGTLVLKSTFHGAAPVETWPIVVKEITVVGSRAAALSPRRSPFCAPARSIPGR